MNSHTLLVGIHNGTATLKRVWQFLIKLNTNSLYDLAVPPVDIYSREINTYGHMKTCMWLYKASFGGKIHMSFNWWIHKWTLYLHTVEYYLAMKRTELLIHATTWVNLTCIMLCEKRQIQKVLYCVIPFTWNSAHLPSMRTVLSKPLVLASPSLRNLVLPLSSPKAHGSTVPMSQYAPATHLQASLPPRVYLLQSHLLSTKSKPPASQCALILPRFSQNNLWFMLLTLNFEWS